MAPLKLSRRQLAALEDIRKLAPKPTRKRGEKRAAMDRYPLFAEACVANGLPRPVREHGFALPARKWRFDWCWPEQGVYLEVDGGVFAGKPCQLCGQRKGGRHNRGGGWKKDAEKKNAAACMGWRALVVMPEQLDDPKPELFEMIRKALEQP